MDAREAAYNRMVQGLIDRVDKLSDREVSRVFGILEDARAEIEKMVATTEWRAEMIPQMRDAVNRAAERFRQRYTAAHKTSLDNMWNAGIDMVDSPLSRAGIRIVAPELNRTTLEVLQGYSVDLIRGLTDDLMKKINGELTLGVLGQKTSWEVMQGIGRNLKEGAIDSFASRAETIARTELGRIHSAARQARIEAVAAHNPELRFYKRWIHSGNRHFRPNHRALHNVVVPLDKNFPGGIPYPHAPGLPAKEVINCACTHVITMSEWEKQGGNREPIPYQDRAAYNNE